MKKINRAHTGRNLLFATAVILLVAVGYLAWAKLGGHWPFTTVNKAADTSSTASAEDRKREYQADLEKKQEYLDNAKENGTPGVVVPVPSSNETIEMSAEKKDDLVLIKTSLKGYEAGGCKLHITNGTRAYDDTTDIIYQPEFSTCAGFSVPLSALGKGTWNIDLSVTPYNGSSVIKTLTYEAQ